MQKLLDISASFMSQFTLFAGILVALKCKLLLLDFERYRYFLYFF